MSMRRLCSAASALRPGPVVDRLLSPALAGERRAWDMHNRAVAQRDAGRDVLILSMGNPHHAVPTTALEGTIEALRRGEHGYVDAAGIHSLRTAIAAYQSRRIGGSSGAIDAERVVVTQGCQNALYAVMASLLSAGDEVLVPIPHYVTYPTTIAATGGRCVQVETSPEDGFRITASLLRRQLTPRTRAVLLTTPCNPTGVCPTPVELSEIVEMCAEHSLALICDEVYSGMEFDGLEHINPASLPRGKEVTVSVGSCSKIFSMTGWRVGWMTSASKELCDGVVALNESMHFGLSPFVQSGAADAMAELNVAAEERLVRNAEHARRSEPLELDPLAVLYQSRRDALLTGLKNERRGGSSSDEVEATGGASPSTSTSITDVDRFRGAMIVRPGLVCRAPDGGMFCMVDVRSSGVTDTRFAELLLERHAISVLPATAFGENAAGHVRIGLLASKDQMRHVGECVVQLAGQLVEEGGGEGGGGVVKNI